MAYLLIFLYVKMSENLHIYFYCTLLYNILLFNLCQHYKVISRKSDSGKILLCGKGHQVLWCLFLMKGDKKDENKRKKGNKMYAVQ